MVKNVVKCRKKYFFQKKASQMNILCVIISTEVYKKVMKKFVNYIDIELKKTL